MVCIEPWFLMNNEPLTKGLVYFDKLVYNIDMIHGLEQACGNDFPNAKEKLHEKLRVIEILEKAGLITEYSFKQALKDGNFDKIHSGSFGRSTKQLDKKTYEEETVVLLETFRSVGQLNARTISNILNKKERHSFTPIIRNFPSNLFTTENYSASTVLSIVFKNFPTITDDIDLEKFIEFKRDPDTILKLGRLREWVLEISKKNYSEKEIEQKIDYLLMEYSNQLEIHKLKYELDSIETFIITSLEILENIAKLNFSKAAKVLFDIRKRKLNLLEAEQKLMGKELALIHKLNEKYRL